MNAHYFCWMRRLIVFVILMFSLVSCSVTHEETPADQEGGISGTGHHAECQNNHKSNCQEPLQIKR
jgi:hypothetical protein